MLSSFQEEAKRPAGQGKAKGVFPLLPFPAAQAANTPKEVFSMKKLVSLFLAAVLALSLAAIPNVLAEDYDFQIAVKRHAARRLHQHHQPGAAHPQPAPLHPLG